MKKVQESKSTILLVSVYEWDKYEFNKESQNWERCPREFLHEIYVRDIVDMVALFHRFGRKVKYKKPTDKNWYTYRAMMNRLFKKEIDERIYLMETSTISTNKLTEDVLERERNNYSMSTINKEDPKKSKYYRRMPSGDYLEVTGWA